MMHRHKWAKLKEDYQPKNNTYIAYFCLKCNAIKGEWIPKEEKKKGDSV